MDHAGYIRAWREKPIRRYAWTPTLLSGERTWSAAGADLRTKRFHCQLTSSLTEVLSLHTFKEHCKLQVRKNCWHNHKLSFSDLVRPCLTHGIFGASVSHIEIGWGVPQEAPSRPATLIPALCGCWFNDWLYPLLNKPEIVSNLWVSKWGWGEGRKKRWGERRRRGWKWLPQMLDVLHPSDTLHPSAHCGLWQLRFFCSSSSNLPLGMTFQGTFFTSSFQYTLIMSNSLMIFFPPQIRRTNIKVLF